MLILHLSDIHFRKGEVGTAMDPNAHLRNELLLDAEKMCDRIGEVPEAIVVSGDIAFAGDADEYEFALSWLNELCVKCRTDLTTIFVVPGNHDVSRSIASRAIIQSLHRDIKNASDLSLDGTLRGLLTDPEASRLLYESLGEYNDFAGRFFCDLLPPDRTQSRRDLKLNDGSILRLVGLNSAFVSSSADKSGDLFVDPASFQIMRERGVENVVLCHHPYEWLRQGNTLRDHLNDVARLHLFGHDHTSRIEPARDWFRISASAAHPDRTEPGWEPGYNLITLEVSGSGTQRKLDVCAHVRVWQQRPGQFRPKMDRESDVFYQSIELDAWLSADNQSKPQDVPLEEPVSTETKVEDETARSDAMDTLRNISIRFFRLSLSQKSAIAGKLSLLEDDDTGQPDFERFRRVLIRARDRGLVEDLDREIKAVSAETTE